MIYGLYLSATGVLANSHRQDVIANNLANVESVGFKRDLAVFQEQRTEAKLRGLNPAMYSNRLLEGVGGGLGVAPTVIDSSPGELEQTGNPLDVAIEGLGYFTVQDRGRTLLTRDGRLTVSRQGYLALAGSGQMLMDEKGKPIQLQPTGAVTIERDGTVAQNGQPVARVGLFDVPEQDKLTKHGAALLAYTGGKPLRPADALLRSGFVERSNAEPTAELSALLDAQRQLEANANLIRYQDQTLGRLVNDVGRIG